MPRPVPAEALELWETPVLVRRLLPLVFCLVPLSACTTMVVPDSPLPRIGPHGPPADLRAGETLIDGSMVASAQVSDAMVGGRLMLSQGFSEELALRVEGSYRHGEDITPSAVAARAGLIYTPVPHFAIHLGGGGGGGEGGGFAGPDLGFVLGYVNPYFIPYLGVRGALVATFAEQTLTYGYAEYEPQPTFNWEVDLGFAVPLNPRHANEMSITTSLSLGSTHIMGGNEEVRDISPYQDQDNYYRSFTPSDSTVDAQLSVGLRFRFGIDNVREDY